MLSGRPRRGRQSRDLTPPMSSAEGQVLREFVYLDEVSVQSLLASLIGELPSEVTSLSSRSVEAEVSGSVAGGLPGVAKSEVSSRFKGASGSSDQVLSRAVAESLFKRFYEIVAEQLIWSPQHTTIPSEILLERGSLIEVEVDLSSDPIYGFSATMGVFSDIAKDYPPLLDDPATALIFAEAGPVTKVLERLLVGLVPIKSKVHGLVVGERGGAQKVAPEQVFAASGGTTRSISIVGVTEQSKYWRDVRRVLFSGSRFTLLGRVNRSGIQNSWTPVKLTEVMREIAPQFPDMITRVGQIGYSTPVNTRQEANRAAMVEALMFFALYAGGAAAAERADEIRAYARTLRDKADSLVDQGVAFDQMSDWLVGEQLIDCRPENERDLRIAARRASNLEVDSKAKALSDFRSDQPPAVDPTEALIDLEVIAIYW